jgi:hypothetical protein
MTVVDTFGAYVRARLGEWGREFCFARDCEYLGHLSKNLLQVLIEHHGEIPGRVQGFKPLEVSPMAHQIELIVSEIARDQPDMACVLRAYYCGTGRRKVERYETSLLLIANVYAARALRPALPTVNRFLRMVEVTTGEVRGMLLADARGLNCDNLIRGSGLH